jgi:hypothetical protein
MFDQLFALFRAYARTLPRRGNFVIQLELRADGSGAVSRARSWDSWAVDRRRTELLAWPSIPGGVQVLGAAVVTAAGRPAPAETPLHDVFALFQELTTARGGRGGACCLELLSCGAGRIVETGAIGSSGSYWRCDVTRWWHMRDGIGALDASSTLRAA